MIPCSHCIVRGKPRPQTRTVRPAWNWAGDYVRLSRASCRMEVVEVLRDPSETVQRNLRRHGLCRDDLRRPVRPTPVIDRADCRLNPNLEGLTTLELAFDSKSLRTICESEFQADRELGATAAEILKHRLADLRAARSAKDLVAGRPRAVNGPDGEYMVVDLCNGKRLVFAANHTNNPMTEMNHLDWARVTRVKVLRIESDHA